MCLAGTWLGILVIAGQAKKTGAFNVLTALLLFFDVAFKVGATVGFELWERFGATANRGPPPLPDRVAIPAGWRPEEGRGLDGWPEAGVAPPREALPPPPPPLAAPTPVAMAAAHMPPRAGRTSPPVTPAAEPTAANPLAPSNAVAALSPAAEAPAVAAAAPDGNAFDVDTLLEDFV